jgi:ring-1,2-phenylacetyl-CoA epoxidase subunit PaaC
MAKLVQINIARTKAPIDSPLLADFAAQLETVNSQAEASTGFIWRLKDETGNATTISVISPFGSEMLVNLSVWDNPDSLKAFVYRNQNHGSALKNRTQWFETMDSPHFAMWWLNDIETPTLIDAKRRLQFLADNGETPYAFTFKKSFNAQDSISEKVSTDFLLHLADDALIHSQRISEWCGHGPILEEDLALGNVALDYLGQARLLYGEVSRREGKSRGEDDLAYFRNENDFLNSSLVELPNSSEFGERDYAVTVAKLFLHSAYMLLKWRALQQSSDRSLAAIASKSLKECRYHFDHAHQWVLRFGDGTGESHSRIQAAFNYLMPYTNEWFTDSAIDIAASDKGISPLPSSFREGWLNQISSIVVEAGLAVPSEVKFFSKGKEGYHSESLSLLLAEMQSLARQHPSVNW